MPTPELRKLRADCEQETLETLRVRAAALDVKGRSSMNKGELIDAIVTATKEGHVNDTNGEVAPAVGDPAASTDHGKDQAEAEKSPPAETGDDADPRALAEGEKQAEGKPGEPVRSAAVGDAPKVTHGTLYSVSPGRLSFMHEQKLTEGKTMELAADVKVFMKDRETFLDDLKRGDTVIVTGDPGTEIRATR